MPPRRLERLPRALLSDHAVLHEATTLTARLLGLAFLRELPPGHALFIPHCGSVHTFGMRCAIDVAFLDEDGCPLRVERGVRGGRVLSCRGAFAVVEARAGEIERFLVGRADEALQA